MLKQQVLGEKLMKGVKGGLVLCLIKRWGQVNICPDQETIPIRDQCR